MARFISFLAITIRASHTNADIVEISRLVPSALLYSIATRMIRADYNTQSCGPHEWFRRAQPKFRRALARIS